MKRDETAVERARRALGKTERVAAAEEAQARFKRRIGESIDLLSRDGKIESWRIVDVAQGDVEGPVILANGDKKYKTVLALDLERIEKETKEVEEATPQKTIVPVSGLPDQNPVKVEPKAKEKVRFREKAVAIDATQGLDSISQDDAAEALHRNKEELSGFSGWLLGVVKHNIGQPISKALEVNRARKKILKEKNFFANQGGNREDMQTAVDAVIQRFIADHEEYLHKEGDDGERRDVFGDGEAEKAVKNQLNDLIREAAVHPEMTGEEIDARRDAILDSAAKLSGRSKRQGEMYVDNFKELVEKVRIAAAHAGGIDNLDIDLDFVIGKAKFGARTEHEKNLIDSVLAKLDTTGKGGRFVGGLLAPFRNELAVAAATFGIASHIFGRSQAAKVGTFGVTAALTGLYSYFREKGLVRREHAVNERQKTLGGETNTELDQERLDAAEQKRGALQREYDATSPFQPLKRYELKRQIKALYTKEKPRRDHMDEFQNERVDAVALTVGARGFLNADQTLRPGTDLNLAMAVLAQMDARVHVSNQEKVDLLQYTSPVEAEVERLELDRVRMELRVALRTAHAEFQQQFDDMYRRTVAEIYGNKESGINVTRTKLEEYARRRAATAATTAVFGGAAIGFVGHELWALATHNDTIVGGVSNAITWLREYLADGAPVAAAGAAHVENIAGGVFTTPAGTHFVPQADGTFVLESIADHRVIASGLEIDNGVLAAVSQQKLEALGAVVSDPTITYFDSSEVVTERIGNWDWLHEHAPEVQQIKRDIWLGNDTPSPIFDFNEQGLHWGDVMGVNANGDFVMDMSIMTSAGSWQGSLHVDALKEMGDGNLRLILTMSEGTQNHAVEILVNERGQAIIPAGSDVAKTFFDVQDGKTVFLGRFAEIAVDRGFTDDGVHHLGILATHEGKGLVDGVITRTIGECIPSSVTNIDLPGVDHPFPPIILPPIIPIRSRKPLERLNERRGKGGQDEGEGEGEGEGLIPVYPNISEQEKGQLLIDMSPRIRENPNARLDTQREMEWYFQDMERRYPGYDKEIGALNKQVVDKLSNKVDAIVALAVAGHGEGKNIYRTLQTYAVQKNEDGESVWSGHDSRFEILLYVNWPKGQDPTETLDEIECFQRDFPDVNIQVCKEEIDGKIELGWIKRKAFDLACKRYLGRGRGQKKELYIIANDADTLYSSPTYLTGAIETMDRNPNFDALLGRQDLDPEVYEKNPTFHAIMRFWQFMEAILRAKKGNITTQGRNTVFRGSSYCAVGGNRTKDFWADIEFGKLFQAARDRPTIGFSNKSWVMVDPRREIDKFKEGELLALTWADFNDRINVRNGGRADHALPENMDMSALANAEENDSIVVLFKERLQDEIQAIVDIFGPKLDTQYPSGGLIQEGSDEYLHKAFAALGVKARLSNVGGKIQVYLLDTSKLRKGLELYVQKDRKSVKLRNNPLYKQLS